MALAKRDAILLLVGVFTQLMLGALMIHTYANVYPPGACFANGLCTPGVDYNQWLGMVFPN